MFSVLREECHVGYSREFVGTVYCTYGESNTTIVSSNTGVKQRTFHWLISDDIAQKEMVSNGVIIHHLSVITCISYEMILTISQPKLVNIAPL